MPHEPNKVLNRSVKIKRFVKTVGMSSCSSVNTSARREISLSVCSHRHARDEIVLVVVLIVGPKLFIEPGTKAICPAFERERPRIVNNFAVERVAGLRIVVLFREMNWTRPSNLAMRLE